MKTTPALTTSTSQGPFRQPGPPDAPSCGRGPAGIAAGQRRHTRGPRGPHSMFRRRFFVERTVLHPRRSNAPDGTQRSGQLPRTAFSVRAVFRRSRDPSRAPGDRKLPKLPRRDFFHNARGCGSRCYRIDPPIDPGLREDQNFQTDPAVVTIAPQEAPKGRKTPEAFNLEGAQQPRRGGGGGGGGRR